MTTRPRPLNSTACAGMIADEATLSSSSLGLYAFYEDLEHNGEESSCHTYTSEQEEVLVDAAFRAARAFAILSVIFPSSWQDSPVSGGVPH